MIISPGVTWAESEKKQSNFKFNLDKNLWGILSIYNFHLPFNWENISFTKYSIVLFPIFKFKSIDTNLESWISLIGINIKITEPPLATPIPGLCFLIKLLIKAT